jgi:type 1 fimbriae regulatory protein FimB/type 1 fimbriae regulatory protein FimE
MRCAHCADYSASNNRYPSFVFTSERGSPFTTAGFARLVERAGVAAKIEFGVHPHMLRHACGFALANEGHDTRSLQAYLGHKNIQHTVRYTELMPNRFKNFWKGSNTG